MRLTEVAHQTLVRPEIDLLVAEENDPVGNDGVVQFLHLFVAERPGQVDIANLRPDMR